MMIVFCRRQCDSGGATYMAAADQSVSQEQRVPRREVSETVIKRNGFVKAFSPEEFKNN